MVDIGLITNQINLFWERWSAAVIVAAAAALLLLALIVIRKWRRSDFSGKASIGFAAVQAGVTWAVVLGVYEFFSHVLHLPTGEAVVLALFIEAAVWAAVGFIAAHAKTGKEGFGPAGAFFWTAILGGGTLAILGSSSTQVALGRSVIVVLGAYMWYLRLVQIIHRPQRTRFAWTWTPTRLLQAIGAMQPVDDEAATEGDAAREHQVRRIARLIRWSNSIPPWRWLGQWLLPKRAETTTEEIIVEARRRFAAAYVLRDQTRVDSPVMSRVIAAVQQAEEASQRDLFVPDSWVSQPPGSRADAPAEPPAESHAGAPTDSRGGSQGGSLLPHQVRHQVTHPVGQPGGAGRDAGGASAGDTHTPDELIHRAQNFSPDSDVRMAWLWHASGGTVSGRQLAKAGGTSPSTGIRRRSQWRTTPPPDPRI